MPRRVTWLSTSLITPAALTRPFVPTRSNPSPWVKWEAQRGGMISGQMKKQQVFCFYHMMRLAVIHK